MYQTKVLQQRIKQITLCYAISCSNWRPLVQPVISLIGETWHVTLYHGKRSNNDCDSSQARYGDTNKSLQHLLLYSNMENQKFRMDSFIELTIYSIVYERTKCGWFCKRICFQSQFTYTVSEEVKYCEFVRYKRIWRSNQRFP